MAELWFTSDLHLGHANIIKYSHRPFPNIDEMNAGIVRNWNDRVAKTDKVFLLGDVLFLKGLNYKADILNELNGNITLILGNHDKALFKLIQEGTVKRFSEVREYYELRDNEKDLYVLCHFPFEYWNKSSRGSFHLHGHSHGAIERISKGRDMRRLDVGVDVHRYAPISFPEVQTILKARQAFQRHHEPVGD